MKLKRKNVQVYVMPGKAATDADVVVVELRNGEKVRLYPGLERIELFLYEPLDNDLKNTLSLCFDPLVEKIYMMGVQNLKEEYERKMHPDAKLVAEALSMVSIVLGGLVYCEIILHSQAH